MKHQTQSGQALLEYALLLLLIGAATASSVVFFGDSMQGVYKKINCALNPSQNLFIDNFGSGLGGWTPLKNSLWSGSCKVTGGKLVCKDQAAVFRDGVNVADSTFWVDTASLKNDHESSHESSNGIEAFFRASNLNSLQAYAFEIDPTASHEDDSDHDSKNQGTMVFRKWDRGSQIDPPLASAPLPANFNWDNPQPIKVVVSGDTFTAYLDGGQVLQARDGSLKSGTFGLGANSGSTWTINNVKVDPNCGK